MASTPGSSPAVRLHRAARVEDALHEIVERRLRQRGWHPVITAYTGYGAPGWARVMARVVLSRRRPGDLRRDKTRGWRAFTTSPVHNATVRIQVGDQIHETKTDRSGYVDCRVTGDLDPGWASVRLSAEGAEPAIG